MSINATIIAALAPLSCPVSAGPYNGTATTYITFNYFSSGDDFADNEPQHERLNVQVHYFCSLATNSVSVRDSIKQYLFAADFTWPTVTDATDSDGQHWVFECEYVMGVDTGG